MVPISGQTADLNTMVFSPDSGKVAVVANDGTTRVYRPAVRGGRPSRPSCNCGNEIGWGPQTLVALARSGDEITALAWRTARQVSCSPTLESSIAVNRARA